MMGKYGQQAGVERTWGIIDGEDGCRERCGEIQMKPAYDWHRHDVPPAIALTRWVAAWPAT